jgi:hypothetical protein
MEGFEKSAAYALIATLPRADEGFVKAVSAVADASGVNLAVIGGTTTNLANQAQQRPNGLLGDYVDIYADAADVGIVAGATQASVTGANVPSLTATGTGVIGTPVAGLCRVIPKGTSQRFFVTSDTPWLGFIGSGAGFIRIFQVSK